MKDIAEDYFKSGNLSDLEDDEDVRRVGDNSGEDPEDGLDDLDVMDLLREGRKFLILDLIRNVRAGMATPAEKAVLAKMLKDNGVILGDPEEGAKGSNPRSTKEPLPLPSFEKPEYDR